MYGLYIHMPFCASRCIYCGFYSTTDLSLRGRYVDCLCREMSKRRGFFLPFGGGAEAGTPSGGTQYTIYIGGGTPSQLSSDDMEKLFRGIGDNFAFSPEEVTVEVNPDDVSPRLVRTLRHLGVNRVSMGVQTFDDRRLRFLRRRHTAAQAVAAIDAIRAGGIDNISIDLMFGFPEESVDDWRSDVQKALRLDVRHISAYCLSYEEGTPLHNMWRRGAVRAADDDTCADMFDLLAGMMRAAGFEHYEISNFARPGFRSRHNSIYWHDEPYLGIGAAAHSYDLATRRWNVADLRSYIEGIESGTVPATVEKIDATKHFNDLITTALRTSDGLCASALPPQQRRHLMAAARKHIDAGMLALRGGRLCLTRRALFVSDMIMSDLMIV